MGGAPTAVRLTCGGTSGDPRAADRHSRRVQGTPRCHLWWWKGGGRVAFYIPKTSGKPASRHGPGVKTLSGGPDWRAYAAQPSYPAKEEVTVVVSAANSAARKRSRPSSSAARDSRVPDQPANGAQEAVMSEDTAHEPRSGAGSRAAKAREELAAVPSQDLPGDLAVADALDTDDELDEEADLDAPVDLESFDDLDDDLADPLGAVDLEIADAPDADLPEADLPDDTDGDEDGEE